MNSKTDLLEQFLELAEQQTSYRVIMADGIVDDNEIEAQVARVNMLKEKLEKRLSVEDFTLVSEFISELNVLSVICNSKSNF